jgi:hypothetical protein
MLDKTLVFYLKLAHGLFNLTLAAAFGFQARLGWRIRRSRRHGVSRDFAAIKRHRKLGPLLAGLGLAGYGAGLGLVTADQGTLAKFPIHLAGGTLLALCLGAVYVSSRRIRGAEEQRRLTHFSLGLALLALYAVQILSGLDAFF